MKQVFKRVECMGMIVQDAQSAAEEYAQAYGLGPWKIAVYENVKIQDSVTKIKTARCSLKSYDFEVIEPLDPDSMFGQWLKNNGNGMMFLSLETVDDAQKLAADAEKEGRTVLTLCGDDSEKPYWLLDYTKELGFYLAVHQPGACFHGGKVEEDQTIEAKNSEVRVSSFCQLGIVVKDFYGTMDLLYQRFGLGPWQCIRFDNTSLSNVVHLGKAIEYTLDVSHAMLGDVEFELLSPLDNHSTFGKYLEEHGNGMHHVSLALDSPYDDVLECFKKHGRGPAQTAIVAGFEFCAFCDHTQSIGLYLEMGKVIAEPSGPPPEMPLYPADAAQ